MECRPPVQTADTVPCSDPKSSMFLSFPSLSASLSSPPLTLHFNSPFRLLSLHPFPFFHSTLTLLHFPSLRLSLSPGWVPAVGLVALVAGVTAQLSGVAGDQGGRLAARTMGAERLRLTAGHLSRAISVGAEACSALVGPAYCEDQRQSVSLPLSLVSSDSSSTHLPPNLLSLCTTTLSTASLSTRLSPG